MASEDAIPGLPPIEMMDERWSLLQWVIDRHRRRSRLLAAAAAGGGQPAGPDLAGSALARLREWLSDQFPGPSTLTRRDRGVWAAAGSLEELCGLTGLWLTGEISSQPGYYGPADVDEAEAPGLTAALIALNQAGFLTRNSQAGFDGEGYDGARWTQVAAVTGYASWPVVDRLQAVLAGTGYRIQSQPTAQNDGQDGQDDDGVTVTRRDGEPYTVFGRAMTGADIDFDLQGCSAAALEAARGARQVVIWDPVPGRNTLWHDLRQALQGETR